MIYIKVELWPLGDDSHPHTIGQLALCNDASQLGTGKGNYDAVVQTQGRDNSTFNIRVENFDRGRDVWDLVFEILKDRQAQKESGTCRPESSWTKLLKEKCSLG